VGERGGFQRRDGLQLQFFVHGHGPSDDHSVVHGVDEVDFIGCKKSIDEKLLAQSCGVVSLCILRIGGMAKLVIGFHEFFDLSVAKIRNLIVCQLFRGRFFADEYLNKQKGA
jgi:hypothetical protein